MQRSPSQHPFLTSGNPEQGEGSRCYSQTRENWLPSWFAITLPPPVGVPATSKHRDPLKASANHYAFCTVAEAQWPEFSLCQATPRLQSQVRGGESSYLHMPATLLPRGIFTKFNLWDGKPGRTSSCHKLFYQLLKCILCCILGKS